MSGYWEHLQWLILLFIKHSGHCAGQRRGTEICGQVGEDIVTMNSFTSFNEPKWSRIHVWLLWPLTSWLPLSWHESRSCSLIFVVILKRVFLFCNLCIFSRCVSNQRPLLDSGTMGTKGHTEIIVPNLTESYNSHVSLWKRLKLLVFCAGHVQSRHQPKITFLLPPRGTPQKRRSHSALSSLSLLL